MSETEKKNEDQYLSTTVLKAIDILNLIARGRITASEICVALKLNKTTVHRLLYTLEYAGFIEQQPNGNEYQIGIKLVGICSTRVNDIEIIAEAKPYIISLVQQINQPVHLGVFNAGKVVYVDKIDVINTIRMYSAIGRSLPVHCSALGKALLLDWPDDEILSMLRRYGMQSFTDETVTVPEMLIKEIQEARICGYTEDNGEHEKNVYCIATPIYDYRNTIIAAISTAATRDTKANNSKIAPQLIETAAQISARLGKPMRNS